MAEGYSRGRRRRERGPRAAPQHSLSEPETSQSLAQKVETSIRRVETSNPRILSFKSHLELDYERVSQEIVEFIQTQAHQREADKLLVPLSGGVDSAVVASLASKTGLDVRCMTVTDNLSYMRQRDLADAKEVVTSLKKGILHIRYDATPVYGAVNEKDPLIRSHTFMGIRRAVINSFAEKEGRVILSGGNKTEELLGVFCLNNLLGEIFPIGDLYKTQVYGLAQYLALPDHIVTKASHSGVEGEKNDEELLGVNFTEVDVVAWLLERGESPQNISRKLGLEEKVILRWQKDFAKHKKRLEFPVYSLEAQDATSNSLALAPAVHERMEQALQRYVISAEEKAENVSTLAVERKYDAQKREESLDQAIALYENKNSLLTRFGAWVGRGFKGYVPQVYQGEPSPEAELFANLVDLQNAVSRGYDLLAGLPKIVEQMGKDYAALEQREEELESHISRTRSFLGTASETDALDSKRALQLDEEDLTRIREDKNLLIQQYGQLSQNWQPAVAALHTLHRQYMTVRRFAPSARLAIGMNNLRQQSVALIEESERVIERTKYEIEESGIRALAYEEAVAEVRGLLS